MLLSKKSEHNAFISIKYLLLEYLKSSWYIFGFLKIINFYTVFCFWKKLNLSMFMMQIIIYKENTGKIEVLKANYPCSLKMCFEIPVLTVYYRSGKKIPHPVFQISELHLNIKNCIKFYASRKCYFIKAWKTFLSSIFYWRHFICCLFIKHEYTGIL